LLAESGRQQEAILQYEAAKTQLSQLSQDHPEVPQFRDAQADCCAALGQLYEPIDRERSAEEFRQALALRKKLVQDQAGVVAFEAGYLDALRELQSLDASKNGSAEDLSERWQHSRRLEQLLVAKPAMIYDLSRELNLPVPRLDSEHNSKKRGE
jgi:hypothetical protein